MQKDPALLSWLAEAPEDILAQAKSLKPDTDNFGAVLRQCVSYKLPDNVLDRLAVMCRRREKSGAPVKPLSPISVSLVGNCTLDYLADSLRTAGARHSVFVQPHMGEYDQLMQEAINPGSSVNTAGSDVILIFLDPRNLPLTASPWEPAKADKTLADSLEMAQTALDNFTANSSAQIIITNLVPTPEVMFGSFDKNASGTMRDLINRFNAELETLAANVGAIVFDTRSVAEVAGFGHWHDIQLWNMGKVPCSLNILPFLADHIARILGSIRGKQRKVLVLDLDNTVWGGIIGDDGMTGIKLAQGDAVGEAHLQVQNYAKALKSRGIVLAVCSKNTDSIAREPFRDHPDMILKEDDIAVFQANWIDKASNLEAIAEALSLGLDSFVFLDDNPAERSQVRQALPMVAVPEVSKDPSEYATMLMLAGYFEATNFVLEDAARAEQYRMNAKRAELQKSARSLDDYIASLEMDMDINDFDDVGLARITQLINKTNQFNLTTRRYTDAQVKGFKEDENVHGFQIRLKDKFGDNGMISVVIAKEDGKVWDLDTWLMSCRVLGRGVEKAVLDSIAEAAKVKGAETLTATYIPTDRNGLVSQHYDNLGFSVTSEEGGTKHYAMKLVEHERKQYPITMTGPYGLS